MQKEWHTATKPLKKIRSASHICRNNAYIQKAVASGKGNNEYYRRRTRSNLK